jgi:hypothetical protein
MDANRRSGLAVVAALILTGTAPIARAAAAQTSTSADFLHGEWKWHDSLMSVSISFLPNGRYDWDMKTEGIDFPYKGAYHLAGNSLTLDPDGGGPQVYQLQRDKDQIVLSGGVFPAPRTFTETPGSEAAVAVQQQKEEDNQKAAAAHEANVDAQWRARIQLAPSKSAWPHGPIGAIPADTKPDHRFAGATVFKTVQGYTQTSTIGARPSGGTGHQTMISSRWYFLPNGRFYADRVSEQFGGALDPTHPGGTHLGTWGAYRILPGGDTDTVKVETDAGEKLTLKLTHGRRNLVFGESVFTQVQAANDALDQILDSLK